MNVSFSVPLCQNDANMITHHPRAISVTSRFSQNQYSFLSQITVVQVIFKLFLIVETYSAAKSKNL